MHNIQALLDAGVRVSVKAPVLNLYYSELPQIKEIAEKFGIPFRTGFEIFPSIDNDDSVQQFSVPLADSLKYEFEEFAKRPRTFGEDYDVELVDLQKKDLYSDVNSVEPAVPLTSMEICVHVCLSGTLDAD